MLQLARPNDRREIAGGRRRVAPSDPPCARTSTGGGCRGAFPGGFMQTISTTVVMEDRPCQGCGKMFRVMATSQQKFHSIGCQMTGGVPAYQRGGEHQRALQDVESRRENVTVAVGKTPSTAARETFNAVVGTWPTSKNLGRGNARATIETKKKPTPVEWSGDGKTASDSCETKESIMHVLKNDSEPPSTLEKTVTTPPEASTAPSASVSPDVSQQMSLLGDSARHLHGLMLGLSANQPDPSVKLYDPDRVMAACQCAKQITALMRLQLDAAKFKNKLDNEK